MRRVLATRSPRESALRSGLAVTDPSPAILVEDKPV
jgi:hypothetical protein